MNDIDVGRKIREYRKAKNLNIKELAEMTGLTSSLLSQIERNLANPSINTLKVISKALNEPLYGFFMETNDTEDLIVTPNNRKKLIFTENQDFIYELLTPNTKSSIEFINMVLSPNTKSSEEPMGHAGDEVAYVLEGVVHLYYNDKIFILEQGDSLRIAPHSKHRWENKSDSDAKVIFAITPPSF